MESSPRRRFDATWLPFGMMIGFVVGMGFGLMIVDDLLLGAGIGFAVGIALGVVLGLRGRRGGPSEEEIEDAYQDQLHGYPRGAARPGASAAGHGASSAGAGTSADDSGHPLDGPPDQRV